MTKSFTRTPAATEVGRLANSATTSEKRSMRRISREPKGQNLERRNLVPNSREPAFPLGIGDRAAGDKFDGCVSHVITEDGVIGGDVIRSNGVAQHHVLGLTGKSGRAPSFGCQGLIWQHC